MWLKQQGSTAPEVSQEVIATLMASGHRRESVRSWCYSSFIRLIRCTRLCRQVEPRGFPQLPNARAGIYFARRELCVQEGTSALVAQLRPYLLVLSVILIAFGFYKSWRAKQCNCRASRISTFLLWFSAIVVFAFIFFPQVIANLLANLVTGKS